MYFLEAPYLQTRTVTILLVTLCIQNFLVILLHFTIEGLRKKSVKHRESYYMGLLLNKNLILALE